MALFGPQARLERCLWWQELIHWPNGASQANVESCYDRVFGRAAAPSGPGSKQQLLSIAGQPIQPKNDLLTVAVVLVVLWLVWKFWK